MEGRRQQAGRVFKVESLVQLTMQRPVQDELIHRPCKSHLMPKVLIFLNSKASRPSLFAVPGLRTYVHRTVLYGGRTLIRDLPPLKLRHRH